MNGLDFIRMFFDVLLVPTLIGIWSIQGRVSRIEGRLDTIMAETERRKYQR